MELSNSQPDRGSGWNWECMVPPGLTCSLDYPWHQPSSYIKACYGKTSCETSEAFLCHLTYFAMLFLWGSWGEISLRAPNPEKLCFFTALRPCDSYNTASFFACAGCAAWSQICSPHGMQLVHAALSLMSSLLVLLDSEIPVSSLCQRAGFCSISPISWERRQRDVCIHIYSCVGPKVITTRPGYCL